MAFPLKMSMTCRDVGDHHQATPSSISAPLWGLSASAASFSVREGGTRCLSSCLSLASLLDLIPTHSPAPVHALAQTHTHTAAPSRSGTAFPQPPTPTRAHTHPAAARHHEWGVVVTVLEAAVRAAADQRAHQREEPAARRRVQRRAARIHLSVHVGAVLRGWRGASGPPPPAGTRAWCGVMGAGPREGRGRERSRTWGRTGWRAG